MDPLSSLVRGLPLVDALPPFAILVLLIALALWSTVIKGFALWHAARRGQPLWFVALLVVNSLGILELVYLLAFRADKRSSSAAPIAKDARAA